MIISLAGQKGGVGKSTIAITLAVEFFDRGKRVVLVDADPQGSARTWADVAAEHHHDGPTVISMGAGLHRSDQLPLLAKNYDVTVVDCPPAHGELQRAAIIVADVVLLPCSPSPVDVWALASSLELIEQARIVRPDLAAAIVVTRKDVRTAIGRSVRASLEGHGLPVLRTELGNRVAYAEAIIGGSAVTRYESGGLAALEARNLADELEAFASNKEQVRVA